MNSPNSDYFTIEVSFHRRESTLKISKKYLNEPKMIGVIVANSMKELYEASQKEKL